MTLKNRRPHTQPIRRRIERSFGPASKPPVTGQLRGQLRYRGALRDGHPPDGSCGNDAVGHRQPHQWGFRLEKTDRLVFGIRPDQNPGSNRDPRRTKQDCRGTDPLGARATSRHRDDSLLRPARDATRPWRDRSWSAPGRHSLRPLSQPMVARQSRSCRLGDGVNTCRLPPDRSANDATVDPEILHAPGQEAFVREIRHQHGFALVGQALGEHAPGLRPGPSGRPRRPRAASFGLPWRTPRRRR